MLNFLKINNEKNKIKLKNKKQQKIKINNEKEGNTMFDMIPFFLKKERYVIIRDVSIITCEEKENF